ncbi:hypothetical protein BX661DRAFT_182977, partial [Kickxella alabastrina]|uniref:uncharacterized protein n=1 Tax=Kickxella alabastrina TaxID=61397 RepID=UPI0022202B79
MGAHDNDWFYNMLHKHGIYVMWFDSHTGNIDMDLAWQFVDDRDNFGSKLRTNTSSLSKSQSDETHSTHDRRPYHSGKRENTKSKFGSSMKSTSTQVRTASETGGRGSSSIRSPKLEKLEKPATLRPRRTAPSSETSSVNISITDQQPSSKPKSYRTQLPSYVNPIFRHKEAPEISIPRFQEIDNEGSCIDARITITRFAKFCQHGSQSLIAVAPVGYTCGRLVKVSISANGGSKQMNDEFIRMTGPLMPNMIVETKQLAGLLSTTVMDASANIASLNCDDFSVVNRRMEMITSIIENYC